MSDDDEEDSMPALVRPPEPKTKVALFGGHEEDALPALQTTAVKRPFEAVSAVPAITTATTTGFKSEEGFSVNMPTQQLKICLQLLADRTNPVTLLFQHNEMEMYTTDRDSPDFSLLQFFQPYIATTTKKHEVCVVTLSKASRVQLIRELHAHQTLHERVTLRINAKEPKPFTVDVFGATRPVECKLVGTTLPDNSKKKLLAVVERVELNALQFVNVLLHASQFSNLVDFILELDVFRVAVVVAAGTATASWTMKLNKRLAVGSRLHMKNLPLTRLVDVVTKGIKLSLNCTMQVNEQQTSINLLFEDLHKFALNFFVKEKKLK